MLNPDAEKVAREAFVDFVKSITTIDTPEFREVFASSILGQSGKHNWYDAMRLDSPRDRFFALLNMEQGHE